MLLVTLSAAASIAVIPKLKRHRDLASMPLTGMEQPSAIPQSTTPNTRQDVEPAKPQLSSVAEQQIPPNSSGVTSPAMTTRQRDKSTQHHVHDLTGEWHVMNTVDKTAYKSFKNMQVGFRLKIRQNGKDFTATGEKASENGRQLPANSSGKSAATREQ